MLHMSNWWFGYNHDWLKICLFASVSFLKLQCVDFSTHCNLRKRVFHISFFSQLGKKKISLPISHRASALKHPELQNENLSHKSWWKLIGHVTNVHTHACVSFYNNPYIAKLVWTSDEPHSHKHSAQTVLIRLPEHGAHDVGLGSLPGVR